MIFIDWFTPAYKAGGPIRSMEQVIEYLKDQFDFFVYTSNKDLGDNKELEGINANKWTNKNGFNVLYSSRGLNKDIFMATFNKVKPSVIYINGLFSLPFSIKPLWYSLNIKTNTKIIVAPRGMLGEGALKFKKVKKKIFLLGFNKVLYNNKVNWHATDENEVASIKKWVKKPKIHLISNFYPILTLDDKVIDKIGRLRVIFLSRISEKKNLLFLIKQMSRAKGEFFLRIVGPLDEPNYWEKCEKELKKATNVSYEYLGPIKPNQLSNLFQDIHFFSLPTYHENFGHAIAEALSYNTPVIISTNTPFRNLEKFGFGYDISLTDQKSWISKLEEISSENEQGYHKRIAELRKNYNIQFDNKELKKNYLELLSNEKG